MPILSLLRFINPLSLANAYAASTTQKQRTTPITDTDKEFDELTIKLLKIRTKNATAKIYSKKNKAKK